MKKKIAAMKKAAWEAAKKDTAYDPELLKLLETEYKSAQKEADDEDAAANKGKDGKAAGADDKANVIELSEISGAITKAVNDALAAQLPEAMKGQVTLDGIKALVDAALASQKVDSKALTADQVKSIATTVSTDYVKTLNLPSKIQHGTGDAKDGNGKAGGDADNVIEIPFGLTKGNLPLHMKQLMNCLLRKPMNEGIDAKVLTKGAALGDQLFGSLRLSGVKALTTTGTGTGAEWIPRDLTSELLRRLYLESQIAQLMLGREIDMPTDPYDLPLSTTRPVFYRNAVQNKEGKQSDPGTGKTTLTTQKLMALVQYSYEANEDSIIPLLPLLQRLLGEAAAFALESAIINGDTTGTHQDSDTALIEDAAEKSWKGFRKLALAQAALKVDLSTGGIARANLIALKKKMKKYGKNPRDLMWIAGVQGENDFLNLDEVITVDKRGAGATTVTGTLPSYLGIPIVTSEAAREDLNASGVYDGATTTKGSLLLVNHGYFLFGNRREFTVEVDRNIRSQTNDIVASFRKAFQPQETPDATNPFVAIGYNYNS